MNSVIMVLLVGVCLGAIVACGTTIESAKADIPASVRLDELYVVLGMGSPADNFNLAVAENFEARFKELGIKAEVHLLSGLELEVVSLEKRAAKRGAKYVFALKMEEATYGSYYVQTTAVYDLMIFDVASERMIWRAQVMSAGMGYGRLYAGGFVDTILDALKSDGLI